MLLLLETWRLLLSSRGLFGLPFSWSGEACGEDCGPVAGSAGTGVDAADFSVESAATGVAILAGCCCVAPSAGGDDDITEWIVRSRLRRQFATISSPRKEPNCSTFCNGGWKIWDRLEVVEVGGF